MPFMIAHVPPLTQFKEQETLKNINIYNYKHNLRTLNRKNETFSQNISLIKKNRKFRVVLRNMKEFHIMLYLFVKNI